MKINDYILVHGKIINIKNHVDDKYIWFDISNDEYYKDKDGKLKNYPSFFSARISKTIANKYILDTNIEIIVKGIPKGYLDKNGYRQNYIHVTEINGEQANEDMLNQIISYDTDGVMLWNGKRCESIPTTKEKQLEIQKMINKLCGKDDEQWVLKKH